MVALRCLVMRVFDNRFFSVHMLAGKSFHPVQYFRISHPTRSLTLAMISTHCDIDALRTQGTRTMSLSDTPTVPLASSSSQYDVISLRKL